MTRKRRAGSSGAYEARTAAKTALGARFREARELKGLTVTEAALALGYTQPVHLSQFETGLRLPPLALVPRAALLFGTTCDFLMGLVPEPEADPGASLVRLLAVRTAAEVDRLIDVVLTEGLTELRRARPETAATLRLASATLEANRALRRCRELSGEAFDDLPAGAPLVARVELAADLAAQLLDELRLGGRLTLPSVNEKEGRHGH